ncbi:hypothetical protein Hsw_0261 [Hymenobacter swuensis DY53]|uniref:STAS/SEC14 domain-containing protein n=1 Tax=Hymenobacter swuensis DY53 TaxID=1227739 RepID=W8EZV2_9BACT|nr:hypothetical protein Hsw_0261 [Hymenobacter swuensis DY53]
MVCAFESLFMQIEPSLKLLRWDWQGPMDRPAFEQAFEQLLECSSKYHVRKWLADVSRIPLVGTDEQAWLSETWLPRFVPLQVRTIALVLPVSLHNQLVVESLLTDGRRQVRADIQFFSDVPAALDWLTTSADTLVQQLEQEWQEAMRKPGAVRQGRC